MKKTGIIFTIVTIGILIITSSSFGTTLFGPKQYDRKKGSPNIYKDSFTTTAVTGEMIIHNGHAKDKHRVTSARIFVNGHLLFRPKDFNNKIAVLKASIDLQGTNKLKVELRSKPGTFLTIEIRGEAVESPRISLQAEPAEIQKGETATLKWNSEFAESCSIDSGIGVVDLNGSIGVSPSETTTYTITATGPGGISISETTVVVKNNPVPTVSLAADPLTIECNMPSGSEEIITGCSGDDTTLSWNSTGAENCYIEPEIGYVDLRGSTSVRIDKTTTFTITAAGPGGIATKEITVTVNYPPPVVWATLAPSSIIAGKQSILEWESQIADTCVIEPGMGSVAASGSMAVSPAETTTYTITATGPGGTASQNVTLMVNNPPSITSTAPAIATEDVEYVYNPIVSDMDSSMFHWTLTNAPPGMTIDSGMGRIAWTPGEGTDTSGEVTVMVDDMHGGIDTEKFMVIVTPVNDPPVITSRAETFAREDSEYTYQPIAVDPDSTILNWSLSAEPIGMTIDPLTGLILWTPVQGVTTSGQVMLTVSDGSGGTDSAIFTIAVANSSSSPVACDIEALTDEDMSVVKDTLCSDKPDDDALSFRIIDEPHMGMVSITDAKTGAFIYTPNPNANGADTFTFMVTDASSEIDAPPTDWNTGTVTIMIHPVNDSPEISGTPITSIATLTPYVFAPKAADVDGDALEFLIKNKPVWADFDSATGRLTGTPGTTDAGVYADIEISVADSAALVSLPAFTITVIPLYDLPTISITEPDGIDDAVDSSRQENSFTIQWTNYNTDNGTISLYYDTDKTGTDGILIAGGLSMGPDSTTGIYEWNMTGLPQRSYYLYAMIDSPEGSRYSYSTGVLTYRDGVVSTHHGMLDLSEYKILPTNMNGFFGDSVSISGDVAIVGDPSIWRSGDLYEGAAWIFKRNGSQWQQLMEISMNDLQNTEPDGMPYFGKFGRSVSISSDYAIVGAPQEGTYANDSSARRKGTAYIFKREGDTWVDQVRLLPQEVIDYGYNCYYGEAVAISGDYAAVTSTFATYIFKRNGDDWAIHGTIRGSGSSESGTGASVSIDGDTIVVDEIYIYKRIGETWMEEGTLAVDGESPYGKTAAVDGDQAIAGFTNGKSAYIFKRSESGWEQEAKLNVLEESSYDYIRSVSIRGNHAAVGVDGAVYLFERIDENWIEQAEIISSDLEPTDRYGHCIALDKDETSDFSLIVGARNDDGLGSAYIYQIDPPAVTLRAQPDAMVTGGSSTLAWTSTNASSFTIEPGVGTFASDDAIVVTPSETTTYKIVATGSGGEATASVTIRINPPDAPTADDGFFETNEDTPLHGELKATDPNGSPLVYEIVSDGTNGTVAITDSSTGAFVYSPMRNRTGTDQFSFRANDGTSDSNTGYIAINIMAANDAPVFESIETPTAISLNHYCYTPVVTDPEENNLIFTIQNKPDWANFDPATGELCGTPTDNDVGKTDGIVILVSDGESTTSYGPFQINIIDATPTVSELAIENWGGGYDGLGFGNAVAISGDYAIVAADKMDCDQYSNYWTNCGSAYIFKRDGLTWQKQAQLTDYRISYSAIEQGDRLGHTVAMDRDYAVVGSMYGDLDEVGRYGKTGEAFVYKRHADKWIFQDFIIPEMVGDLRSYDGFAGSLDISGDYIIAGAANLGQGAAYIFKQEGDTWAEHAKLTGPEGSTSFGRSVSIFEDDAVVGSAEAAYVYHREGDVWNQYAVLSPSHADDSGFGKSVSIHQDRIIIGANIGPDFMGAVYIFEKAGFVWTETARLQARDATGYDYFGTTVDIRSDYAAVGTGGLDSGGDNAGATYLFQKEGDIWKEYSKILKDIQAGPSIDEPASIAIESDSVIIGYPGDDIHGINDGSASIHNFLPVSIRAESRKLPYGESTRIVWYSNTMNTVAIEPNIGSVEPAGTLVVAPTETTNYRITASGPEGDFTESVTITVIPQAAFSAASECIVKGNTATLSWTTQGASSCVLDNGIGEVNLNDSLETPVLEETTTYTLTVQGPDGVTIKAITITVLDPAFLHEVKLLGGEEYFENWQHLSGSRFGENVAISGDFLIVGSFYDSEQSVYTGAAYLYQRNGLGWKFHSKLLPSLDGDRLGFGETIAIHENYAVVGSKKVAYLFKKQESSWVEYRRLNQEEEYSGAGNVAIEGTYLVINGDIYDIQTETWNRQAVANGPTAISGDYVIAGDESGGGTAYIYKNVDGQWLLEDTLHEDNTSRFGHSVAIDGEYALVGDYDTAGGDVYAYHREENGWVLQQKLEASDKGNGDLFGLSLALSGNLAVISAVSDDLEGTTATCAGAVYLFNRQGAAWTQVRKIVPSDPAAFDRFGWSVGISGTDLAVGSTFWEGSYIQGYPDYDFSEPVHVYSLKNLFPQVHLTADRSIIGNGDPVILSWSFFNADTCDIEPDPGEIIMPNQTGETTLFPTQTTTYTITASNANGISRDQVTVTMSDQLQVSLDAEPSCIRAGETTTLTWHAVNAQTVEINPGNQSVPASGSMEITPTAPTVYTITATGAGGTATDSLTVICDSGPTAAEQAHLEAVNRARMNPAAEAARLGISLNEGLPPGTISSVPMQPLVFNPSLVVSARCHSRDMIDNNYYAHESLDGTTPARRMEKSGYVYSGTGENIGRHSSNTPLGEIETTLEFHDRLFVDQGVIGRGHRKNILNPLFRDVGISLATGPSEGYPYSCKLTCDFGSPKTRNTYITGVIYHDLNGNGIYDAGEGLENAAVYIIEPDLTIITNESGAYTFAATPGDYTVQVTKPDGTGQVQQITVGNLNVKADFLQTDFTDTLPPAIVIEATPNAVQAGGTTTLTWRTINTDSVVINGLGTFGPNGSQAVTVSTDTTYTITATGPGGTATSSVTITILEPPEITLHAEPATIMVGKSTTLTWTTIGADSVTISPGGGSNLDPNGSISVTPKETTTYTITATGPGGSSQASVTTTVNNPFTLEITEPGMVEIITKPYVMVQGTIANSLGNETGINVNGITAIVHGSRFVANHVPLEDGENTIVAVATDSEGSIYSVSTTLIADLSGHYIRIIANPESGLSPFDTFLKIDGSFPIPSSTVTWTGPGTVVELSSGSDEYEMEITGDGIYYLTVEVEHEGVTYEDTVAIEVLNKTELDALLKGKWNGMRNNLISGDIEGSVRYFSDYSQDRYRQIFTVLTEHISQIVADMQEIEMINTVDNYVEYRIVRQQLIGGTTRDVTYYIYIRKDQNGIWKIEKF